ncbi:carboxymuconolactone decarboxylase family protein [Kutzneria sp. NPDC051319]|uniref:carboxymuconolactone decarboxylase family protein n=1 Tax=Kutzneria sp. NPDC051319 TaxID=3155047 RepID=UPI00343183A8
MALIEYPDLGTLAEDNRKAIEHFTSEHGRPTLLRMMLAYSPPAQEAMDGLYHPVMQNGQLSRRLKESLVVAASQARECKYCAGGHSLFLVNEFGYEQDQVRAMRGGEATDGWSDAELELVRVVRAAAADPASVTEADIAALRDAGWSDAEIVEGLVMASHAGWTNTVAQALHLEDDLYTPEFSGYF